MVVLGSGISGLGAGRLLLSLGQKVWITDDRNIDSKAINMGLIPIETKDLNVFLEEQRPSLVISPGVPFSHSGYQKAVSLNLPIYSEPDLAYTYFPHQGNILGVTGTNGKSTTTAMIVHLLNSFGQPAYGCGNFGRPLSDFLATPQVFTNHIAVMELSSFQLEQSQRLKIQSGSVFFNFSQDHIDRHPTEEAYFKAKWRLESMISGRPSFLVHPQILAKALHFGLPTSHAVPLAPDEDFLEKVKNLAPHNRENGFYAVELVHRSGFLQVTKDNLVEALKTFSPLPHRLEPIGFFLGDPVINDSKATNVASLITALKAMDRPVYCALGGYDKKESFKPLLEWKDKWIDIFPFGMTGERIAKELNCQTKPFPTLEALCESLKKDHKWKKTPGTLLFSPGCSSYDEFRHFEHRGDFLREFWKGDSHL